MTIDSSTAPIPLIARLDSTELLAIELAALLRRDARLVPIAERAGPFELRTTEPGFPGLARIICGQQLSTQSAAAIWSRFSTLDGALDPAGHLRLSEESIRKSGFSSGKYRTLHGVAEAVLAGAFAFDALAALPAGEAMARLCGLTGVGPWTAELYLMFCAAHPDIFPAGDLALQRAVEWGFGLDARPSSKSLIEMAKAWAPHRTTAALLLWRYYRAIRQKEGIPV